MRFIRKNPLAFLAVPVVFALVGIALVFGGGSQFLAPYMKMASFLMSEETENPSESEPLITNLFVPTQNQPMPEPDLRASVPRSSFTFPKPNEQFGTVTVEGTDISCPLYNGDTEAVLIKGAGMASGYINLGLPGMGSLVLITGYNNTVFRDLEHAEVGAHVAVQTHYGTYLYEITGTAVADEDDESAVDTESPEEKLILYTGYPFGSLGHTRQRYYVYGQYVSGPRIDYNN